ncbi:MAG: protein kinase [Dokdonella sp.]
MQTDTTLDAARWARLKDHLADLAGVMLAERSTAIDALDLSDEDRRWLENLADPLLSDDQRLAGSHASSRAAVEAEKLRWRHGETIGQYRIESLLGRGGMGEVYEARSLDDGQLVALKVLRAGLDQTTYARISANEQRALRRLDDPRIAKFIEAFADTDGGTCLVLEWVDGEPLQSYCRGRRFDVASRLRLFVEVCHAVATAHQQLVVHRDLKPSNVLVTPEGQVKLLDFGVAKLLDDATTDEETQTHGNLFTLEYAAPEQILHEPVSTATDIYALGGLLYRLLTDVSPYEQLGGRTLVKAVLEESPQRISDAIVRSRASGKEPPAGPVDGDLDRIIGRAMQKEAKARYRSALELALDVQAVLDGRPISGGGDAAYRTRKFLKRHRASAVGSVIALAAVVAAVGFSVNESRLTARHAHEAAVANRFLLTALDLTDQYSPSNQGDLTLGEVLVRAVARARTDLVDEPVVRATVLTQLGRALQRRGNTELAMSAAQEAYSLRKIDDRASDMERGQAAQQLGSIEIERNMIDLAEGHLHEALVWSRKSDETNPVLIETLTSLGKLASMRGDARQSLAWYEQILPLRQSLQGDHRAETAMDFNNLGTGLYNLSRFRDADRAYAEGIAVLESILGNQHPRIGYILIGQAAAAIQLGRFDSASEMLDRSDALLAGKTGSTGSVPRTVNSERLRAIIEYFQSDYSASLTRMALVMPQQRLASPVSVASTLSFRARVELASGQSAAAMETLAESEALFVDHGRRAHVQRWLAHGLHGVALAASGKTTDGDARLETAFEQIRDIGATETVEFAEIALRSGAAARRRGDFALALERHRIAEAFQARSVWLGELGAVLVIAELILDGGMAGATTEAQAFSRRHRESALAALQRLSPRHALVSELLANQSAEPE